jgi:hypothetical protein
MNTRIAALIAGGAIVGSGLAGFGLSAAMAQTEDSTTTTEQPAAEGDAPADGTAPEGCEGRGPGGPGGPGGHGFGGEAAAEALGLSEEELRTQLQDGATLAEIAEEQGVDRQELVDAIVTGMEEHLATAVEEGHLTQAEADERLADAEERAEAIVDGEMPAGGPGGMHGGPGAPGEQDGAADDAEDTDAQAEESSYAA